MQIRNTKIYKQAVFITFGLILCLSGRESTASQIAVHYPSVREASDSLIELAIQKRVSNRDEVIIIPVHIEAEALDHDVLTQTDEQKTVLKETLLGASEEILKLVNSGLTATQSLTIRNPEGLRVIFRIKNSRDPAEGILVYHIDMPKGEKKENNRQKTAKRLEDIKKAEKKA